MPAFTSFTVAGGTGNLGSQIALALLDRGFKVQVLSRKDSNAALTDAGATIGVTDYSSETQLTKVLKDTQVVINALGMETLTNDTQTTLAKAAKAAGVELFVPNDFGVDYDIVRANNALEFHPFVQDKVGFAKKLEEIGLDRLQIFTGIYASALARILQIDTKSKSTSIAGDGKHKFAITTEHDVGQYMASAFKNLKETELRNKTLRIASDIITPGELLKKAGDYKVEYISTDQSEKEAKDLSLGVKSFYAWLRLVIARGAISWEGVNDSDRLGYKAADDVAQSLR